MTYSVNNTSVLLTAVAQPPLELLHTIFSRDWVQFLTVQNDTSAGRHTGCLEEPLWSKHGHPQILASASFLSPTGTGFYWVLLRESTPADWGLHLHHKGYCRSHASLNSCLTPELNTWHTGSTKPKQTCRIWQTLQPNLPFYFLSLSSGIDLVEKRVRELKVQRQSSC